MIKNRLFQYKAALISVIACFMILASLNAGNLFKAEYEAFTGSSAYKVWYQEADRRDMPQFMAMVESLAKKIGATTPHRLIILAGDDPAFAGMRDINPNMPFPFLIVGSGIFKLFTDEQITAIIAHELAHIKHDDAARLDTVRKIGALITAAVTGGCIIADPLNYVSYVTAAACGIGGWLLSSLTEAYVSRSAEKRADLTAVEILDDYAPMLEAFDKLPSGSDFLAFSHHPSLQDRIHYVTAAGYKKANQK